MCVFCQIVRGEADAHVVLDDDATMAFLDVRPLFEGHTLIVPKQHHETLVDLPADQVEMLFLNARRLAGAVQAAMSSHGSLVLLNNKVSQSVPHLHVHVIPRRFKDGLRGFLWPRRKYRSAQEAAVVARRIHDALREA